ncbi:MAG: Gfo/Idh/MocA family oxidoreductase [Clostridia bacterium]|nr:Gfo/Idh/MocA family oxidoreductase [Clostridia bacterium]
MKKLKVGIVGYGQRGRGLLAVTLGMEDIDVVAVCDEYEDRTEEAKQKVIEKRGTTPFATTDYRELVAREDVEAVIVATAWEAHVEVSIAAMKAGKYVGVEVGGAYSIEDCWRLVHTSEETGMPCMMIENCCYGEKELMCLNMAKKGVFGEIVHCTGAYFHDLRSEVSRGNEIRHYRLRNYMSRNCDNYPTHALGPIAKLLNINRGNRFLSLVSMASKARGLHEYIVEKRGAEDELAKVDFKQGDVVTTIIKCANGETIRLSLGITTPRAYSRDFDVTGTKGFFQEETNSIVLDRDDEKYEKKYGEIVAKSIWNNVETYKEEFSHPLWAEYHKEGIKAGHGGMDWLVLRAFYESAIDKKEPPIDVYDTAAWMSISALTEESIANGGMPVSVPDFTNGKWLKDKDRVRDEVPTFSLQTIPEKIEFKI